MKNLKIDMPKDVKNIIQTLNKNGFEGYVVGGCVRDALLNKEPKDWDITTNAKPEDIKKIFKRTIDTGIEHGTVTAMFNKEGYEITTYRIDGDYSDSRRPDSVKFVNNLEEDLKRRDLTINAMAYNDKDGLIDLFNGQEDLKNKNIRTVGNAEDRFSEDALRILRAYRFASKYGFNISDDVLKAANKLAPNLEYISKERIKNEFDKILMNDSHIIYDMYKNDILTYTIPELNKTMDFDQQNINHDFTVGIHCLEALEKQESKDLNMSWALLLHDIGKPDVAQPNNIGGLKFAGHAEKSAEITNNILNYLKFDNKSKSRILNLVKNHDLFIIEDLTPYNLKLKINEIGLNEMKDICNIKYYDIDAQSDFRRQEKYDIVDNIELMIKDIELNKEPLFIKDLKINGNDMINIGFKNEEIGKELNSLLLKTFKNPDLNTSEDLTNIAKKDYLNKHLEINGHDLISLGFKQKEIGNLLDLMKYKVLKNEIINDKEEMICYIDNLDNLPEVFKGYSNGLKTEQVDLYTKPQFSLSEAKLIRLNVEGYIDISKLDNSRIGEIVDFLDENPKIEDNNIIDKFNKEKSYEFEL